MSIESKWKKGRLLEMQADVWKNMYMQAIYKNASGQSDIMAKANCYITTNHGFVKDG